MTFFLFQTIRFDSECDNVVLASFVFVSEMMFGS